MKVSLAIDNCFAMKRWTQPEEWMALVNAMDVHFIEASADNEIDPLYSTPAHWADWIQAVTKASQSTGVRVANLYSGHGTYCTLGLAHLDPTVRHHIKQDWMMAMMRQAAALGTGLGFYVHAFPELVMTDPARYEQAYQGLIQDLQELSIYAEQLEMGPFGIEQMYSPHQIPWTLDGARDFLSRANAGTTGAPVYLTLDTGHQSGQRRFLKPTEAALHVFYEAIRQGQKAPVYLGTTVHYEALAENVRQGLSFTAFCEETERFFTEHPYLFSRFEDGDPYRWMEDFGCYSPIVHLQQTDGTFSAHKSFTTQNNAWGIIKPPEVLQALYRSSQQNDLPGLKKVDHVYLTLEIFLPTACDSRVALEEIAESAKYWRHYIPQDGVELSELI